VEIICPKDKFESEKFVLVRSDAQNKISDRFLLERSNPLRFASYNIALGPIRLFLRQSHSTGSELGQCIRLDPSTKSRLALSRSAFCKFAW
jgi:hypothetical protein